MAQLTDSLIRQLPLPATGSKIHYAGDPAGFGVRVTAGGARSFVLNFRVRGSGRERRYTIGKFPDWSVGDARRRAQKLRRLIAEGGDPLGDIEAERAAPTVAELCDRFEQEHLPRKRPSTAEAYSRMLRLHVRPFFGPHVKVADVVFADVDALHRRVTKAGGNYIANRVVAVLSKMFSLAVRWDMRADNPCKGIERNLEHYRRRYLSGEELVRLTTALAEHPDQQAANAIRLLLLTGARRGEVLSMRWADLDLTEGKWSKPASSTKQKEAHEVPLSAPARQLLSEIREAQAGKRRPRGEFVFPSHGSSGHVVELKKSWRALCRAADITNLRIHDLRHSYASQLVSSGSTLALVGALLGHANPSTTARYAHLHHDPMREATERVGAVIVNAGKPAKDATPFERRRR